MSQGKRQHTSPAHRFEGSLLEPFADWVQEHPDSIAVQTQNDTWTYAQLDQHANHIASSIVRVEGSVTTPIFLLFTDVPRAIASMLSCLKLGRPYVPLSPSLPAERLAQLRDNAQGSLLVTETDHLDRAEAFAKGQLPILDSQNVPPCESILHHDPAVPLDTPAWILYTSGSTGTPKGVVQTHGNLLQYVSFYTKKQALVQSDRLSLLSSYTANIASHDIFSALLNGLTLCAYDVATTGVEPLADWIESAEVTVFSCVPTLFRQLCRSLDRQRAFAKLRIVKLIGEPVYQRDLQAFREHFPPTCRFINRLGSSETGTIRWFCADADTAVEGPNVPVGYPVDGHEILLLDEQGQHVPDGTVGEIVVQSPYLSPGYWRRPDLTAKAFDGEGECRRFHTGDMGHMLVGGCLVHVGRKDSQIKIRGYRVEIAEVEAAILRHPAIEDVLAMPREDHPQDLRLVGYYSTKPGSRSLPTSSELRQLVSSLLPSYMVPNAFVHMDAFPLAPNGKIRRSALPPVGTQRPSLNVDYVAPTSALECSLAHIWGELLHLDQIGVRDNFFDLGGHSLLATRMLARIRRHLRIEVPMKLMFNHPTIEDLAAQISGEAEAQMRNEPRDELAEEMSLEQRIAFESELLQQAAQADTRIPRRDSDRADVPLSFAQERMWFMHQLFPESAVYNVPWGARLRGSIHPVALERALNDVARRYDVLRTVYVEIDGVPQQRIRPESQIPLQIIDACESGAPTEEHLQHLLADLARRPFDLASDGPLRAALVRCDDDDHILLLVGHHIALDGWSCSIINAELNALYPQILAGEEPVLAGVPIQYADVAVWQRTEARRSDVDKGLGFWREKLSGLPPVMDLPISSIDPDHEPFAGDEVAIALPETVVRELKQLAHRHRATTFMVLAATVFSLLHRYTGESDIAIGTPVSGRMTEETEALVGLFVNTLVLREDLSAEPSFAEMIERVRATCLEAYSHQAVPFERIVATLGGERTIDRSPLTQIMLAYRTFPTTPLDLQGIECQALSVSTGTSKLDLSVELWDTPEGMAGRLIYSTRRFRRSSIESLASHFVHLLEAAIRQPDRRIAALRMLGDSEYERVVRTWNAAKTGSGRAPLVHTLFEQAVQRFPDKLAVAYQGHSLTYQQLNARANQVAAQLQKLGAAPNRLIGVSMHRSTDLIASLLGVLKAGAAYLPLDPSFPSQRLRTMMDDASVAAVITQPEVLPHLPISDIPSLVVDEPTFAHVGDPRSVATNVTQEDLAYVMYTSGSTGNPKGVMISHRNVVGFLNAFHTVVEGGPDRVSSNTITYAFDTSIEEIFAPLCHGGTVHVVPYEISLDGGSLARFIIEHGINTAYVVPDLLPGLAETFRQQGGCGSLSQLITGLAPKKQATLQLIRAAAPDLRILNAYGPTEVTYGATAYEFTMASDPEQDVSIGVPFPDYQVYIVNEALEPVPIDVTGELLIGGVGVARGYLNRPKLTSERFIRNPFSDDPEDRVYRTGDLARFRRDGNIDFLGRRDTQVKIRGHRIELREIELALETHPDIVRCHARVYTLAADDVRIAVFVTADASSAPSEEVCYVHLRSRLPEFMMPSAIVFVPSFPLSPTGKIDSDKLPAPIWGRTRAVLEDELPRGEVEQQLAAIWEDVIQIPRATRHASFFELGGHSLLAIRLLARIHDQLGVKIPIRTLFDNPTLASLATSVSKSGTIHRRD